MLLVFFFNFAILILLSTSIIFVGNINSFDFKFVKHLISIFIGIVCYVLISRGIIKFEFFVRYSLGIWFFSLVIIVLNLFIGTEVNGSKGWIYIGNFSFQPAELAKLSLAFVLPWIMLNFKNYFLFFVISMGIMGLTVLPIFLQPDLGFSLLLFFSNLINSYLVGVNGFIVLATLVISIMIGWAFLKPYQLERLTTFLDPYRDPLGSGWQTIQSVNCIINGGIWGKGIGQGMISRLGFLPEKDTDFIFSVIIEDTGVIGAIFIIFWFILILSIILWVYRNTKNLEAKVLASFIFAIIFVQSFINIAMNTMSGPITGLPLPLISYGGTNMVVTLFLLGIINRLLIETLENNKIKKWIK